MNRLFRRTRPVIPLRGVHLDLKGLPPTPARLMAWLDILAAARINLVLVEWEDTYPWSCFPELRCATAYSRGDVERFLRKAQALGIEVVPLVQSLGHMETVLSKRRLAALRELPDHPGDLCPCKPRGREVVRRMIDDVLSTHAGRIRRFHLGGDEAWSLGSCPKCRRVVAARGKAHLYLQHVTPLLEHLAGKGLRPILWDDMMRPWPLAALRRLGRDTDLMCWSYRVDPFERGLRAAMDRFQKAGITLWGASAFKGADGITADVCNLPNRAANNVAWVKEARRRSLAGIVATGWSRYSTFAAPCEGMEASLHALVLAGHIMHDGVAPQDSEEQACRFLRQGTLGRIAGKRFAQCLDASKNMAAWRARLHGLLGNCEAMASPSGESDRTSPANVHKLRGRWMGHLKAGKQCGSEWAQAHRGLVPHLWLKNYVKSRVWMPQAVHLALRRTRNCL